MQIEIADNKVFDMIAHMTQQLFEDEQSVKCLSIEGYKERLRPCIQKQFKRMNVCG